MTQHEAKRLRADLWFIGLSVLLAVWLVRSGVLDRLLVFSTPGMWVESFIAGMFFTSAFTTAPALAVLTDLAARSHVLTVSFFGGIGALVGDLVLFYFIKDRVSEDLMTLIGRRGSGRLFQIAERKIFRWFSPLIAALIIASPLPDEFGVIFLGFAKTRTPVFILFSFLANFLGILAVSWFVSVI